MEKISVEIFGIKGRVPEESGCDGCDGGGCGDVPTMDEEASALEVFFAEEGLEEKVDVKFIDIVTEDHEMIPDVKEFMEDGYTLPLVAVGGAMRFYGGIAPNQILREINNIEKEKEEL